MKSGRAGVRGRVVVAGGLCAVLCAPAIGELIARESFDYQLGSAIIGQAGGSGFSAAWSVLAPLGTTTTVLAGLTHPGQQVSGGSLGTLPGGVGISVFRAVDPRMLTSEGLWISVLYRGGVPNPRRESATFGMVFGPESNGNGSVIGFRASAQGIYQLYAGTGTFSPINLPAPGPASDRTDLLVFRYRAISSGVMELSAFVNPASAFDPGLPVRTANANVNSLQVQNFRYIYGPPSGATSTGVLDEIRFGTTYASVVPAPAPAFLLVGLAALGHRRRVSAVR